MSIHIHMCLPLEKQPCVVQPVFTACCQNAGFHALEVVGRPFRISLLGHGNNFDLFTDLLTAQPYLIYEVLFFFFNSKEKKKKFTLP